MKTKTLTFGFELKSADDNSGVFEGYLSVYDNVDLGNDVVTKGAFAKTISESGGEVPMLWQHQHDFPIGKLQLEDRDEGLWVKGTILTSIQKGMEAYQLIKNGIIKGLSIGYESIKDEIKEGVRYLKEIKLYEGSVVTFPMNPDAVIATVKQVDAIAEVITRVGVLESQIEAMASQLATTSQTAGVVEETTTTEQEAGAGDVQVLNDLLSEIRGILGEGAIQNE